MKKLTNLGLNGNNIKGTIPEEVTKLSALKVWGMSENNLTGTIPEGLLNLTALIHLDLSGKSLTGTVPRGLRCRCEGNNFGPS